MNVICVMTLGKVKIDFQLQFKISKCSMCVERTAAFHVGTVWHHISVQCVLIGEFCICVVC